MLDFWATWCGPCRMSIPLVQRLYLKYKERGFVVVGMNIDEDPSGVFAFVQQFKMTYPVVFAGDSHTPSEYQVEGIPAFIFVDREGRMTQRYEGFSMSMVQDWERQVERLLDSPQ
jgi:thiol-disulfide isomerase/thioredoxin